MTDPRRLSALLAAAGIALGVLSVPAIHPAAAEGELPSSFEAVATGDGLRVSTNIPGAPLSDGLLDSSSGSVQARIDALGVSRALAAAPYPGPTPTSMFDILRGFSGVPIPSYPLVATSDYPAAPKATVAQPGLHLDAHSDPTASEAGLVSGADGGTAGSVARSIGRGRVSLDEGGALVAEAAMETTGVLVGPMRIAKVASRARFSRTAAGESQRERSVEVTGLTVADQSVGLGPQGLLVPGTTIPLPDTDPARKALAQAGVAVRYLESSDSPDAVVAAGLVITQVVPASPTAAPSTLTYTVGRATATVVIGAAQAPASAVSPSPLPSTGEDGSQPVESSSEPPPPRREPAVNGSVSVPAPETMAGAAPAVPPSAVGPGIDGLAPDASPAPPASETPRTELATPPVATSVAPASTSREAEAWSDTLALAVLVPGVALLAAFLVLRRLGVKTTWAS